MDIISYSNCLFELKNRYNDWMILLKRGMKDQGFSILDNNQILAKE